MSSFDRFHHQQDDRPNPRHRDSRSRRPVSRGDYEERAAEFNQRDRFHGREAHSSYVGRDDRDDAGSPGEEGWFSPRHQNEGQYREHGRSESGYGERERFLGGGFNDPDTEIRRYTGPERFGQDPTGFEPSQNRFHEGASRVHREARRFDHDPDTSGQRGRFAGRGPKGYQRSDERLKEDVCDRLMVDPDVDAEEVIVAVTDGEVTLEGSVPDRRMKRRAEDCAEWVSGVKQVHNRIRIEPHPRDASAHGGASGAGMGAQRSSPNQ